MPKKSKSKQKQLGWGYLSPTRKERQHLLQVCGTKCFLRSYNQTYPICAAIERHIDKCTVNCRGLYAARRYAGFHQHKDVLSAVKGLIERYCS